MQRYNNITSKKSVELLSSLYSEDDSAGYYRKYHQIVSYAATLYTQTSRLRSFLKNDITFKHDLKHHRVLVESADYSVLGLLKDSDNVKVRKVKTMYNRLQYVYSHINNCMSTLQYFSGKNPELPPLAIDNLKMAAKTYLQILWEISSTSIVSEIYGHCKKRDVHSFLLTFGWNEFLRIMEF